MPLVLSVDKSKPTIGDKVVFTATSTAEYESVKYYKNGTELGTLTPGKSMTFTVQSVKLSDSGDYSVKGIAVGSGTEEEKTETSNTVKLEVLKKNISNAAVSLSPSSITISKGANSKFTATVTGAPSGTSIVFAWKKDGVVVTGNTSNTYNIDSSKVGAQSIEVNATISGADYNSSTVSTSAPVTITRIPMPLLIAEINPPEINATKGTPSTLEATVTGAPVGSSVSFIWKRDDVIIDGANTAKINVPVDSVYSSKFEVLASVKATDYTDGFASAKAFVKINPEDISKAPMYIHPLPWRNTGFMYLGWWILNEIQKAKELGLDWKTEFDKLEYSDSLETLSIMFSNYDEVEVQESRNGYILGKDAIEAGYFY